jgi:hypothetical protein
LKLQCHSPNALWSFNATKHIVFNLQWAWNAQVAASIYIYIYTYLYTYMCSQKSYHVDVFVRATNTYYTLHVSKWFTTMD